MRVPCAGAIVHDDAGRILLIRRGKPPSAGMWSIPGGRCLPGESSALGCVREAAEETGLTVEVLRFVGQVERAAPNGDVYVIDDFACRILSGTVRAGDDATDARWYSLVELGGVALAPGVYHALAEWGLLPR